jgi:hypothetical protein
MGRRAIYSVTVYLDRADYLALKEMVKGRGDSLSKVGGEFIHHGLNPSKVGP